ncbi:MAG TPA: hypothetical protein VFH51_06050, partial [Myxococcota bacterium]|nr:hypothetical protein [Myxococcota bacterium]
MMSDKVSKSIEQALAQLHQERDRIDGAIAKLEGFLGNLASSKTRRGRASARLLAKASGRTRVTAKQRSRAGWTPDARQAAAERMRNYWAERRKQAGDAP